MKFSEALSTYVRMLRAGQRTTDHMRAVARDIQRIGDMLPRDDIRTATGELVLRAYELRSESAKANTLHNTLVRWRSFFRWAMACGHIVYDPTVGLRLPNRSKEAVAPERRRYVDLDEVRALKWKEPEERVFKLMALVLWGLPLRKQDLYKLELRMINVEAKTVQLRKGKGHARMILVQDAALMTALLELAAIAEKKGLPVPTYLPRKFRQVCERSGVPVFLPHALRHTGGTRIANTPGLGVVDAQKALGHSSPRTTERYIHDKNPDRPALVPSSGIKEEDL